FFFFFSSRRRHTRSYGDWSSDVCSSDLLALGWRGSARHWQRYEQSYYLLAALATPLVVSVHSVVSSDFAVAIVPGWHSTIFPPRSEERRVGKECRSRGGPAD